MIWVTQYICANRHTFIGATWDDASENAEEAQASLVWLIEEARRIGIFRKRCIHCKSRAFHFETLVTRYRNEAEALPIVRELQSTNLTGRMPFDLAKQLAALH